LIQNEDRPGVIGRICSALGDRGINIDRMHVGQDPDHTQNAVLLATSTRVSREILDELKTLDDVHSIRRIDL
jgi:D-3-phosphoglycerate dehydrogenase